MHVARLTVELLRPRAAGAAHRRARRSRGRDARCSWSRRRCAPATSRWRARRRCASVASTFRCRPTCPRARRRLPPVRSRDGGSSRRGATGSRGRRSTPTASSIASSAAASTGPGPAVDWIRLRVPLVAGEPTSPLARVVAAADFGNGVSWVLSRLDGWQFINPDLTVYVHRPLEGEWVCLDAVTHVAEHGVGLAESRLWDGRGVVGRARAEPAARSYLARGLHTGREGSPRRRASRSSRCRVQGTTGHVASDRRSRALRGRARLRRRVSVRRLRGPPHRRRRLGRPVAVEPREGVRPRTPECLHAARRPLPGLRALRRGLPRAGDHAPTAGRGLTRPGPDVEDRRR